MRISTTTLESFRLFMTGDWMTEASLIETIEGKFIPNAKVKLGLAFGKVLEDPDRYAVPGGYRFGDYAFSVETMAPALAIIDRRGVFEAKAQKAYGLCDVVAKADHLLGAHLSEFKTTDYFTVEKYLDSCQWKFMADIFEPSQITYHVFLLDDHENGIAELKGIESLNLYPYAGLHEDCADLVHEFAHFVTVKGLDALLRERQRVAA